MMRILPLMLIEHYYQTCVNDNMVWVQKIITPLTIVAQFILFFCVVTTKEVREGECQVCMEQPELHEVQGITQR